MTSKELQTSKAIIKAASALFAKNGYTGTSVREIAKKAEVNIAAINYHFENKENLYKEVFAYNHTWLAESIEKICSNEELNTADFAGEMFIFFFKKRCSTFKYIQNLYQ